MRMQIIVDIWVLVSMMDFMPDKGEQETGIFLPLLWEKRCDVKALRSCLCLFDLIFYVPSTIFQLNRDGSSWVEPVLS